MAVRQKRTSAARLIADFPNGGEGWEADSCPASFASAAIRTAMKSLIETYDHHLKKVASVPRAQRMSVTYRVMSPWALAVMAAFLLVSVLGLPRDLGAWIIAPMTCVAAVGTIYATGRVAKHGGYFDRTPTDPALSETRHGNALVQALQRVTLNGLSNLTLSTRLRADLKLTPGDMFQLLGILSAENWLDARSCLKA